MPDAAAPTMHPLHRLFLAVRSCFFYAGYASSLVIHATLSVLLGVFMPIHTRFRFFLLWNRFIMWWLKLTCGIHVRIHGSQNVPPAPYVVLSNHQSTWETLFFVFYFMPASTILKQELLNIPFFGWGLRMLRPIAIDRGRPRQALKAVQAQGKERLAEGISVIVFPEGTRVDPGEERRFSNGAAELAIKAGVKALPVAHNAGQHWPGRRFLKLPGTIDLVIGPPIDTAGKHAREVTGEAEAWIRQTLARL